MNKKYLLVDTQTMVTVINMLRSVDSVHGFDNMEKFVTAVEALQKIALDSPTINPPEQMQNNSQNIDPELKAAADAAKAEEEARK